MLKTDIRVLLSVWAEFSSGFSTDLGLMHYFLGLEVWKNSEGIFLNQGKYGVEVLKRFECWNVNP